MTGFKQTNLALPIDIQGGEWNHFFLKMTGVLCVFFVVLLLIASKAPLYEMAVTEGKIVPHGSVIRVEHFEGGIVKKIHFRSGDMVEKGQVIVTLTPAAAMSEQDQMAARYVNLKITEIRLKALLNDNVINFGAYKKTHPRLVADHFALYTDARKTLGHSVASLKARVNQKRAILNATNLEIESIKNQLSIHQEQFQMRKSLIEDGYTTRNSFLDAKVKVAETQARIAQMEGQLISLSNELSEGKQKLSEAQSIERQKWSQELTQVTASISEIDAVLGKVEDRVDRLDVRAPISGIIQSIHLKSIGEVINPGDLVAEMVPSDDLLLAEVRLKPEDITNIKQGTHARVSVTAFDAKEFGYIDAKVAKISPTTFKNDQGEEYYEVRVELDKLILNRKGINYPILPGMVVRAELIKGERSVLRYMLKPLYTAFDNSFGEH